MLYSLSSQDWVFSLKSLLARLTSRLRRRFRDWMVLGLESFTVILLAAKTLGKLAGSNIVCEASNRASDWLLMLYQCQHKMPHNSLVQPSKGQVNPRDQQWKDLWYRCLQFAWVGGEAGTLPFSRAWCRPVFPQRGWVRAAGYKLLLHVKVLL